MYLYWTISVWDVQFGAGLCTGEFLKQNWCVYCPHSYTSWLLLMLVLVRNQSALSHGQAVLDMDCVVLFCFFCPRRSPSLCRRRQSARKSEWMLKSRIWMLDVTVFPHVTHTGPLNVPLIQFCSSKSKLAESHPLGMSSPCKQEVDCLTSAADELEKKILNTKKQFNWTTVASLASHFIFTWPDPVQPGRF